MEMWEATEVIWQKPFKNRFAWYFLNNIQLYWTTTVGSKDKPKDASHHFQSQMTDMLILFFLCLIA